MICPNCSMNFDDNMMYCPNCGKAVNNTYQQPDPYAPPAYGAPAYYQQPQPEKNPTLWQYVGWMIIGSLFGPISIIISIVFACMNDNKPRATYFKAHLIVMAISFVISIIALIAIAFVGFSFTDVITDASYEIYNEFMQIASLIR